METREVSERERTFEAQSKETRKVRAVIADHQGTRSGGGLSAHGAKEDSQVLADIVETIKVVGLSETLKKKLKVLTAYSAFEED